MCYVLQEGVKLKGGLSNPGSRSERIPLVFGVSGHRDLVPADLPKLHEQLRSIFARFRAAYPATPFNLLTPLAEGADRLAAEVALAAGIGLLVPLPMKRKEYERDFATVESLSEFRRLLAKADSHWEIPAALHPTGKERIRQYAEVGEFIARHSHVLILLWDGGDNKKIGGTAWVKKRRDHWVGSAADPFHGVAPPVYGPTIQVVTPRASGRGRRPRPATIGELPPSAAEFDRNLSKHPGYQRSGKRQKRPPLYQFVYQAINSFNESLPDASAARRRTKPYSATRSRL
ncbi:MAG TPA: hypothetical protein VGW39_07355 [Chthoniobacterales bacterium]|nr:hypothetical protein [Chthoniobacterales bacterium]